MTTDQPTAPMSADEPTYLDRQTASIAQEIALMAQARVERECAALLTDRVRLEAMVKHEWTVHEQAISPENYAEAFGGEIGHETKWMYAVYKRSQNGRHIAGTQRPTWREALDAAILAAGETRDK